MVTRRQISNVESGTATSRSSCVTSSVLLVTVGLPFFGVEVVVVTILSGKPWTLTASAAMSLSNCSLPVRVGSARSQTPRAGSASSPVDQTSCSETICDSLPMPSTRIFIA